jgi:hypothetical protein
MTSCIGHVTVMSLHLPVREVLWGGAIAVEPVFFPLLEPLARKTMYLSKHSSGLNIVNIEYVCFTFKTYTRYYSR